MLNLKAFAAALLGFAAPFTAAVAQAQANKAADNLDEKESFAYVLTIDKIDKLTHVRKTLGEWLDANEQVSNRMDHDKSLTEGTFFQRARTLDLKYPEVATIIHKEGVSTLECLLANHVLLKAFMLVGAKKQGEVRDYSAAGRDVNPANLRFVEQHWNEIRKSMQDTRLKM